MKTEVYKERKIKKMQNFWVAYKERKIRKINIFLCCIDNEKSY